MVTICHWENTKRRISNRLAGSTGTLAVYFTDYRCKHNEDIVLKLKEEQEILQCFPELVCWQFFFALATSVLKKRLASEKTNNRA